MRRRSAWIAALIAVAGALGLSAPARADVFDDNPAAASRGTNDLWVFARRTADGAILERHFTGAAWTDWESLGGAMTSGPAVAAYGPYIEVFARGADGAVWQDALVNGAWSGWTSLGGYVTSAPAAIARRGTNYLDVAARGGDNAIYLRTYVPGTGWYPWGSVGGNVTSAPALDSHSDGILDIFARGTDGTLVQQAWNGSQWVGWGSLGGGILGAPTAVNKEPHDLDVYVRGGGDAIYQDHWDSINSWTGWRLLDASPAGSSAAAVSDQAGREILFARAGDEMWTKTWLNGNWSAWTDFGPIAVPPPPPAPMPPQEVDLVAGLHCTPPGGRLRVSITVHRPAHGRRARVTRIVFFTRGTGRTVRVDRRKPFVVRLRVNAPAGRSGRVFARVYFRRSAHGKLHHKTVSRRYTVCA